MHWRLAVPLALAGLLLGPVLPAGAEPYDSDPLGLVPFQETAQTVYTSGTDTWEVWVCDVPDGAVDLDAEELASSLEATITPYFEWLSDDEYSPTFVPGGAVTSDDPVAEGLTGPEAIFAPGCEEAVEAASTGSANGALVVVDAGFDEGYGTAGAVCPEEPFTGCRTTYPANARRVVLGAATVTTIPPFQQPQWITVAHEIGHALNWAHSWGGLTTDPDTMLVSRYDNPMDVMSGGIHTGLPVGAIAYHRYAAGWISPDQVELHEEGTSTYELAAIGGIGTQMVVVPTEDEGHFFVLGARRRSSYDRSLPKAGVEVYEVDQRREVACAIPGEWPQTWPCFATLVRVAQVPPVEGLAGTAHVLGIDEEAAVGGVLIRVLSAGAASFRIRVEEADPGTFLDDDGNLHEEDIERIAKLGITAGCNPPAGDNYCPTRPVTRGEMAAFLVRALGEDQALSPESPFPDVPVGAWYAPYVERLVDLGIAEGYSDGTYRPDASVSRAEMAAFLVRAFTDGSTEPAEGLFADVPETAWYAPHAEMLASLGITRGCATDPARYCPEQDVRRDQMASFLARALEP